MFTKRHIDNVAPQLTEEQIARATGDLLQVRETKIVSREGIALRLLLTFTAIGAGIAIITVLVFAYLTYRDPQNAATHLDLCLKLLQGVMTAIGAPIVFSLALGYLFGRQEAQTSAQVADVPATNEKP